MFNRPLRCAIIDDDPADILLLKTFLKKASSGLWTYDEYEDYNSGQIALAAGDFDIAFIDLNINGSDGLDLIRAAVSQNPAYPIVVVSTLSDDAMQEAAIAAGAYDFLPKDDIDEKTIKRTLRHVFSSFKKAQELRRMADQAMQGSEIKSSFLACMSHDLRTPLNAIIGFSEVLHTSAIGDISPERTHEYAKIITDSAQNLLELINSILDLSKIEQQKFVLYCKWLDPQEFLQEQLRFLKPISDARGITLDLHIRHDDLLLLCDERALRQIFTNLLSNAVKFSEDESIIGITTALHGGKLHLTISDTGIGMTSAETKLAVMPFGQVSQNPEIAQQGTGLGLAIVKGLVEAHGAELNISSRKGAGTRVSVIFPAKNVDTRPDLAQKPVRISAA